jgi:hypothetical protein
MKLRMITGQAGVDFTRDPGQEYDVPQAEALRMIDAGIAVPARATRPERATAVTPASETRNAGHAEASDPAGSDAETSDATTGEATASDAQADDATGSDAETADKNSD